MDGATTSRQFASRVSTGPASGPIPYGSWDNAIDTFIAQCESGRATPDTLLKYMAGRGNDTPGFAEAYDRMVDVVLHRYYDNGAVIGELFLERTVAALGAEAYLERARACVRGSEHLLSVATEDIALMAAMAVLCRHYVPDELTEAAYRVWALALDLPEDPPGWN